MKEVLFYFFINRLRFWIFTLSPYLLSRWRTMNSRIYIHFFHLHDSYFGSGREQGILTKVWEKGSVVYQQSPLVGFNYSVVKSWSVCEVEGVSVHG